MYKIDLHFPSFNCRRQGQPVQCNPFSHQGRFNTQATPHRSTMIIVGPSLIKEQEMGSLNYCRNILVLFLFFPLASVVCDNLCMKGTEAIWVAKQNFMSDRLHIVYECQSWLSKSWVPLRNNNLDTVKRGTMLKFQRLAVQIPKDIRLSNYIHTRIRHLSNGD